MVKDRFELALLKQASPDVIAWLVPAARLFGWLCRTLLVPSGWMAFGTRDGQDPLIAKPGSEYEDDRTKEVLFVRSTPVRCAVEGVRTKSADGYACEGSLDVGIRIVEDPSELTSFRSKIVGSGDVFRRADLQRHIDWEMHSVLSQLAANHNAAELLSGLDTAEVRRLVSDHLGGVCLAGGLAVEDPIIVEFDSPDYREYCRQQANIAGRDRQVAARTRIQQALAHAQRERLDQLVAVLQQFAKAAETRSDLSMADLLQTFGHTERGELYAALWHMLPPARKATHVAVVSGQDLLLFDASDLHRSARTISLPCDLGRLRSVSVDECSRAAGLVMVGARLGVHLLDLHTGDVLNTLAWRPDPSSSRRAGPSPGRWTEDEHDAPSPVASARAVLDFPDVLGGVNAAAMTETHVYATHSELGLLAWPRRPFDPPVEVMFPEITGGAETVRCARIVGGHLWFAVDEQVWAWPHADPGAKPTPYHGCREPVSALAVATGRVYAGTAAGRIFTWDVGDPDSAKLLRGPAGRHVESIDVQEVGAIDHLVVADRGNSLQAIVVEDHQIRRYESGGAIVRRAAVADDLFVAMNDSRDRLIGWNPRIPGEPVATVIIPHLTGSPIEDICVLV